MPLPVRLQVDRKEGGLSYRLEIPDRHETCIGEIELLRSDSELAAALAEASTLLRYPEVSGFSEHATAVGQRLFRKLVPQDLRDQLVELRLPILLVTSFHDFPFELFHDGREFLGLRFAVGRLMVTRADDRGTSRRRMAAKERLEILVVGSDPRGDLPFVASEAEAVHSRLAETFGERANTSLLLTSRLTTQANLDEVAWRLSQGVDILHYCGHVERRESGSVGLLLADEKLLSIEDIANSLEGTPVVFLNGCASSSPSPSTRREDMASVAGGFIRAGARAVIGTLGDVPDQYAAVVAEEFYRQATASIALSEALRRARAMCRDKAPNSAAWLSFVLYGKPTQLFPGQAEGSGLQGVQSRLAVFASLEMIVTANASSTPSDDARRTTVFEKAYGALLAEVRGADILSAVGSVVVARLPTASSAVDTALCMQHALASEEGDGARVQVRIGIDLREVSEFDADGHGTLRVVGTPADMAEHLRKLALPGQVLVSRPAFDGARWHPGHYVQDGARSASAPIQWLCHGQYFLEGVDGPVDVFEAGIEGLAPLTAPPDSTAGRRRFEPDEVAGWRPAVGTYIPHRNNWLLERKIGEGGFGEVWLARHDRLQEARVFKFCFDRMRLRSFRQETRIFRLLVGALGTRPNIARLYDVELEDPPYFLESENFPQGNLAQWADAHGGIGAVPLDVRLNIFVGTAEALAAAHSVDVLHRDLKPSNILIRQDSDAQPTPCLADFGIGAVTDPGRLEQLGITSPGATTKSTHDERAGRAGTAMYAPPESLAGQPHTVKGDVYGLGVLLFQLAVGDLTRPLAPGWERLVDDELLRADVGAMVDGDELVRLGSAAEAADLVRRLPQRRIELEAARRETRKRASRRRALLFIVMCVALGAGYLLWASGRENRSIQAVRHKVEAAGATGGLAAVARLSAEEARLLRRAARPSEEATALARQAEAELNMGYLSEGRRHLRQAQRVAVESADSRAIAAVQLALGLTEHDAGARRKARRRIALAQQACLDVDEPTRSVCLSRGDVAVALMDAEEGEQASALDQLRAVRTRMEKRPEGGDVLMSAQLILGSILARDLFDESEFSLADVVQGGDARSQLQARLSRARLFRARGELGEARNEIMIVVHHAARMGDASLSAWANLELAKFEASRDTMKVASDRLLKALRHARRARDRLWLCGEGLGLVARWCSHAGYRMCSQMTLAEAEACSRKTGDTEVVADTIISKAYVGLRKVGASEIALDEIGKAEALFQQRDSRMGAARIALVKAAMYHSDGQEETAKAYGTTALKAGIEMGHLQLQMTALDLLGHLKEPVSPSWSADRLAESESIRQKLRAAGGGSDLDMAWLMAQQDSQWDRLPGIVEGKYFKQGRVTVCGREAERCAR